MKALTIWQPWASLIVEGFKPFEFRGWKPPPSIIGQRIVLHAAVRPMKAGELAGIMEYVMNEYGREDGIKPDAYSLLEAVFRRTVELPMASGLGTAVLGAPVFTGHDEDGGERYAWPMQQVEKWAKPIPARGAQGFWDWPS